jgi:hypothetical protein
MIRIPQHNELTWIDPEQFYIFSAFPESSPICRTNNISSAGSDNHELVPPVPKPLPDAPQ